MLETEIKKLTAAVTELTAALHTVRLPAAGGNTAVAPTPATPAPAPKAAGTTETAPAATSEPAPEVPTVDVPEPTAEVPTVPTKKALVEKFIQLAQEKDREVAIKLLADFGVGKLPELTDKSKWADFVARCNELLSVTA